MNAESDEESDEMEIEGIRPVQVMSQPQSSFMGYSSQ